MVSRHDRVTEVTELQALRERAKYLEYHISRLLSREVVYPVTRDFGFKASYVAFKIY
jgi:hypothetical protein